MVAIWSDVLDGGPARPQRRAGPGLSGVPLNGTFFSGRSGLPAQSARVRDRPVTVEAIMTRMAATTIATIQRTQSTPELPLPPKAV